MTSQKADILVYDGDEYEIAGVKGNGLLTPSNFGIRPIIMSTACYRGYICTYTYEIDRLYLTEMIVRSKSDVYPAIDDTEVKPHELFPIGQYFELRVPCDFSGGFIIVRDLLPTHSRSVGPEPISYQTVLELILEEGKLTDVFDHSRNEGEIGRIMAEYEQQPPAF